MESIEAELLEDGSKRDGRGRRICSKDERERLIEAYRKSGLTQKVFCEREGLKYYTFISWLGKSKGSSKVKKRKPVFEEVFLNQSRTVPSPLEVQLPSGVLLRGQDAEQLAKLVTFLSR